MEKVCLTAEVEKGKFFVREVKGKLIALVRVGEQFFAFEDQCTHQHFPLSTGFLEGNVIECLHHGARFDLTSGKTLCLPATQPLKQYKVQVLEDFLWLEI